MMLACVVCALVSTAAQTAASATPLPVATPLPIATPIATPSATPSPAPHTGRLRELLLQGGFTVGKVYNDFAPGVTGSSNSTVGAAAIRFGAYALKFDGRSDSFPTLPNAAGVVRFSTIDGGAASIPQFTGRVTSVDVRAEHSIFTPDLYAGISVDRTTTSYGFPVLSGAGFGLEKYPSFKPFDFTGSLFFYPSISGNYTVNEPASLNFGKSYALRYTALKYDADVDFALSDTLYAYIGYGGNRAWKPNAAAGQNAEGPFMGLGARFLRAGAALDEPTNLVLDQQAVTHYNGYVQLAAGFGGQNSIGALSRGADSGAYALGAAYRTGHYALVGDFHQFNFGSQLDPFVPGPSIDQHESLGEVRAEVSVAPHDAYFGMGVMSKGSNNGFAARPGLGLGFEKLPNLFAKASPFASVFYYDVPGRYTALNPADPAFDQSVALERRYLIYEYGVTYKPVERLYLAAGLWGYHGNRGNLPTDETHSAPYIALGTRI